MNHYLYEQQAKSKLNARFQEGDEWRKWRIAHPAGPGLVARVMSFVRGILSRTQTALPQKQERPAPEPTLDVAPRAR